jgi:hypothetical protein
VGEVGIVLHFDGENWRSRRAPTRQHLRAIWLTGSEAWVVGDDATVLHYAAGSWEPVVVPELAADTSLRGVWGDAAGNLWVVGDRGTLLERRAGAWSIVDLASPESLNAVWAGGGEAWAVGDLGTVFRNVAGEWARVDAGTSQKLTSIHGRGNDVWLAGAAGEVRYYDRENERWQRPDGEGPAPGGELRGVQVISGEQVYVATSSGDVYMWDGTTTCPVPGDAGAPELPCPNWGPVRHSGQPLAILGLWASGERTVAVGLHGSIVSWQGESRSVVAAGSLDNYLDISGSGSGDVWVAGDRLLSLREGTWNEVLRDSPRAVYAVQPLDAERALVAGTGGMARSYTGDAWESMDVRADAWLRDMWSDGNAGWLVGSRGSAWGLLNRRLWTALTTPTDRDLLGVWSSAMGTAWAVGAEGVILRHDGLLWAAIPSGPNGGLEVDLRGIWGSAENDIWAVGTGGTAVHWNGSVWTKATEDAPFALNDVWGRSGSDIWAVGSGGTILHYDGASWQAELSGTGHALNALWGTSDRLWAVGEHGTILVKDLD